MPEDERCRSCSSRNCCSRCDTAGTAGTFNILKLSSDPTESESSTLTCSATGRNTLTCISRVFVKTSPAFGRRRCHQKNTDCIVCPAPQCLSLFFCVCKSWFSSVCCFLWFLLFFVTWFSFCASHFHGGGEGFVGWEGFNCGLEGHFGPSHFGSRLDLLWLFFGVTAQDASQGMEHRP